ncbi:olfactory receptor 10A3-like [Eleutherodactylus coqui]|uniref:olfactory receptor 10A3-like n=1 Tax=Eleutherodactylus coqui TaxID=57060 RepID=UPI0034618859
MKSDGKLNASGFVIQGFSEIPELQMLLFGIFLLLYIMIICGNLTIIVTIWKTIHLHTPMYIFLVNLSFIDIASISNILPKLLSLLCIKIKTISFIGCLTQMYVFLSLSGTEFFLLAAMAYDRYVAICHPLHYIVLIGLKQCARFSFVSWFLGFLTPTGHTVLISKLYFCLNNIINHFFCDINPILQIACTDTSVFYIITCIEGILLGLTGFMLILISYVFIIFAILKIKSTKGQHKAFSTCTAHLTCVIIFYGTMICMYMRPKSTFSPKLDKYFSLLYIILVPMLNPIIYSLKNEDIRKVLIKTKEMLIWHAKARCQIFLKH